MLNRTRFQLAAHQLSNLGITITEIPLQLGYSDVAHFARAFRRIAGVTPLAYRQQFAL